MYEPMDVELKWAGVGAVVGARGPVVTVARSRVVRQPRNVSPRAVEPWRGEDPCDGCAYCSDDWPAGALGCPHHPVC